ncbi:MAG: single-stranded DNA-binding protein [Synechococcus sp. SB0662_bin_45]|uniref:Single-stranded DNA-binding protein n=1 Tax=Synechococcus sp. SB0676_bin_10 TaxID=2604869 RepID=A0A6B1F5V7_9SYNE|nr:single-stranded DNA-binding protein [Cyanobacteria bacterium MAG IRC3_bin_20]MCY3654525.1 single-stranded DNA-binding protein [Cyanobacteria bacterium MAG IRC1_bin_28]MDE0647005.1 single-stranded DNA-binding protein [Cyanobacteria bacterium MAG IRC4_bin_6]MXW12906.1 single-stranded DNA-binding protein [Synechococcus sp. SB0668_bin_13]MXX08798.1 single-stranded DNA-binding protein [Synechococcus sp. SB0667_bin_8]MXY19035.1 single-stranded DNA-binding protein [Synechococcus sp. SB0664_bin_36]
MNHCLLEAVVQEAPRLRYTQGDQTPVAEMLVCFDPLREGDPQPTLKVTAWRDLATTVEQQAQPGRKVVLEGRLMMRSTPRPDGVGMQKQAELILSRLHQLQAPQPESAIPAAAQPLVPEPDSTSDLDPEDDIPF